MFTVHHIPRLFAALRGRLRARPGLWSVLDDLDNDAVLLCGCPEHPC